MGTGLLSSAISGMQSAQIALQTAEHNISNQNTTGFNRQRIVQSTNTAMLTGAGFIGQGAHVSTVERVYDGFLTNQINRTQTISSQLEAYYSEISQIDNMLADANSGLSPALQSFFDGVQQVAANPAQVSSRQAMISSAQALVARFQGLQGRLTQMNEDINTQLSTQVNTVNSYASQIAELNQSIVIAQSSISQPANDLLDQRDQLVAELNKLISITTTTNSDGSFNVFFGTGQQLVVGTQVMSMTALPSSADSSKFAIGLRTPSGTQELPESLITGGSLGGLIQFRSESLDPAINDLGRNAASLALTFNAQNALGQDLLGQVVSDASPPSSFVAEFFSVPAPRVVANTLNPLGSPAVTASLISPPPYSNGNFYTNLTNSDYRLDGSTLTLTRLSDNYSWPPAADLAALNVIAATQGFNIASSGAFVAGSSYIIQPTRNAAADIAVDTTVAADVRLIAAAAPIRTQAGSASTPNTGNATISAGKVNTGYTSPASGAPVVLTYDATSGNLSWPAVGAIPGGSVAYASGSTITIAGMSVEISGTPKDGDTFQIAKNVAGVSDGRNVLLLGKLQTQNTMSGQTASYQTAYAQLVSDIGNKTRQISVTGEAQQALLKQSQAARESLSGVNLDEEASNLIRYQQAYQASAQSLKIGTSLFDTLLGIMN